MTYAEFLKSQGATDEDIKVLGDNAIARKAFEAQQAIVAAAADTKRKADETIAANREWAQQVESQNQAYLKERDSAQIEAAAARARIAKMGELGLIEIAEKIEPGSTKPPADAAAAFDASKYVTNDTLLSVAEREGDAIAAAQDIAYEHQRLFPDKPLNFRELRREAVSRKLPVESLWMEKYGVAAARDARSATEKAAYEKKLTEDAVAAYKSQHSQTNPLTAPLAVSRTPFTEHLPSTGNTAGKHPWQLSDAEKTNARMNRVVGKLQEQGLVN